MTRCALLLLLALSTACAGGPPSAPPPPAIGAPQALAAWLVIRPAQFDAQLEAFDVRLGDQTALGPLGAALRRARAVVEDRLVELAPSGRTAADVWAGWGLDRDGVIRIGLATPDGPELGRALVEALDGRALALDGRAAWRLRVVADVRHEDRLRAGLDQLAGRLGFALDGTAADGVWRAHDPAGLRLALRVRSTEAGVQAALDIALPAAPGATVDPLAGGEIRWPPNLDGPIAGGLVPALVGSLESGLQASTALARTAGAGAEARPVLLASAAVLTRCVDRWQEAARHTTAIVAALDAPDGRPRVRARVGLSPRGLKAWTDGVGPLPLATLDGLPAAIQAGLAPAAFPGISADWRAISGCAAGHPLATELTALAIAPALARPDLLPVPGPVSGWPARSRGLAAALVGAVDVEGQAAPTLAGLVRVGPEHPVDPAPLGPGASRPTPEVHARPGSMPVTYGDHRSGDGRALIFGLGPGAHRALIDRLAVAPARGPVVQGHADPVALADALSGAGERGGGVAALRALGERFGRLEAQATVVDGAVHWQLAFAPFTRPPPEGRELDRAPPAK